MGMFSEIATGSTIRELVQYLEEQIQQAKSPVEIETLKRVGRKALTMFEWKAPKWADKYKIFFK